MGTALPGKGHSTTGSQPTNRYPRLQVQPMSLRSQINLLLTGLSVLFVAASYGVQTLVVMPAFKRLEQQQSLRNARRCIEAVNRDVDNLSNFVNDWAAWDDMWNYVKDHNRAFQETNLTDNTFSVAHVNFICILDDQRNVVWCEARNLKTLEPLAVSALQARLQDEQNEYTCLEKISDSRKGIELTESGPLLLSSRPIVTSKREGPIRGTMIMGRFLDASEIAGLADRMQVALHAWLVNDPQMPVDVRNQLAVLRNREGASCEAASADTLYAYSILEDTHGESALVFRLEMPRAITKQGLASARIATVCGLFGGVITLVAMGVVLQWRLISPLQQIAAHAVRVGRCDDLKARLRINRRDEIGTLANELDRMVEQIAASRQKVLDTAHRAGMAEIASDVLHNVGNAMNSMNCAIEFLDERLQGSKIPHLDRATKLLREQAPRAAEFFGQDPRGPKLIDYLADLSDALEDELHGNQADVARLQLTVRHIGDAIASQQIHAERTDFRQDVDLPSLIQDALQLNQEMLDEAHVEVDVRVPTLPDVQLNRSKMLQILVNLIRNAAQAMRQHSEESRQLGISAQLFDDGTLELVVSDTGPGFDAVVQAQLFTYGFTTKPEGQGCGLHYCANAVNEVGGSIVADSAGPGLGASFRIRIPQAGPVAALGK